MLEIDEAGWGRVIDIALDEVWRAVQTSVPTMGDAGSFIAISSLTARLGIANAPSYTAAGWCRSVGSGLGPPSWNRRAGHRNRTRLRPHATERRGLHGGHRKVRDDARAPLGRVGEREETIGATMFLGSDAASDVTDDVLTVNGGFVPSAGDPHSGAGFGDNPK